MKGILCLLVFQVLIIDAVSCDCGLRKLKEKQTDAFERVENIIIADILDVNNETGSYSLQVIEVLKGSTKENVLNGKKVSSCSGFPSTGRWIIYAEFDGNDVHYNICGLSRSFENPDAIWVNEYGLAIPPKDQKMSTDQYLELEFKKISIKATALQDLKDEIAQLRNHR